jgi:thioredoxin 1
MKKLLYFTANWCGPCKMFGPIVNEVSAQFPVEKIDVDFNPSVATKYSVRTIPTVILIDANSGAEILRRTGVQTKQQLLSLLQ